MNQRTSLTLAILSLALAAVSIAFALSARGKLAASAAETDRLEQQLAALESEARQPAPAGPADLAVETEPVHPDLETIAELEAEIESLRQQLTEAQERRGGRSGWEERMAQMKAEDPEGYAEMIRQREERREQMRYNLAERTANFMELDTSFMTDEEAANHEQLIQTMGDIWELTEQFENAEQPPDRETMRELFGLMEEARPLMETERSTMFRQLGNDLGMGEEDAAAFSTYVDDIIQATTIERPRGRGGRP